MNRRIFALAAGAVTVIAIAVVIGVQAERGFDARCRQKRWALRSDLHIRHQCNRPGAALRMIASSATASTRTALADATQFVGNSQALPGAHQLVSCSMALRQEGRRMDRGGTDHRYVAKSNLLHSGNDQKVATIKDAASETSGSPISRRCTANAASLRQPMQVAHKRFQPLLSEVARSRSTGARKDPSAFWIVCQMLLFQPSSNCAGRYFPPRYRCQMRMTQLHVLRQPA